MTGRLVAGSTPPAFTTHGLHCSLPPVTWRSCVEIKRAETCHKMVLASSRVWSGMESSYPKVLFKAQILLVNMLYTTICTYVPLP